MHHDKHHADSDSPASPDLHRHELRSLLAQLHALGAHGTRVPPPERGTTWKEWFRGMDNDWYTRLAHNCQVFNHSCDTINFSDKDARFLKIKDDFRDSLEKLVKVLKHGVPSQQHQSDMNYMWDVIKPKLNKFHMKYPDHEKELLAQIMKDMTKATTC